MIGWDQAAWLKNITLYRDAGILIGAAGQSIWGYLGQWNTTGLDGVHTLYARAFDQAGNYLDSSTVTVIVDNTPPNAAVVTSPVAGTYVKGTIWINATATDAMGLRNVTFYRDDVVLIGTDTTAPYAIQWNTTGLDGAHTLYIRAFDRTGFYDFQIMHAIWINGTPYPPYIYAGNYLDSAPIAIIIDNTAPTSAMVTAPAPGAYVHGTIWINATATDAIGIKNVTFYRDAGILLGTASTAPYGIQCLTGSYGVHTLYVRAFDNAGNYWDSMNIPVTVITMPTIPRNLRVNPGNGQVYLTWLVPASDGGSAITNYKIYRSTSSGNETYLVTLINVSSFRDTNLVNGWTYYYRVSAVNEAGESLWSSEVSCMVNISVDGIQKFGWLIIIFLVAGLVGLSGGILYFNRRTTSTAGKTLRSLKAPIGQKGLKFGKYLSAEVFEKEDSIQLEVGPQSLWKSLMLRFNRLYKSEKWAQALALLGPLKEIAEYLHDGEKIKALSAKYDELKVKRQQNSYAN